MSSIIKGAVTGALNNAYQYSTTTPQKDLSGKGLLEAAGKGAIHAAITSGIMTGLGLAAIPVLGNMTDWERGVTALGFQILSTTSAYAIANKAIGNPANSYLNIGIGPFTVPIRDGKLSRNPLDHLNNVYSLYYHGGAIIDAARGNAKLGFDKNSLRMTVTPIAGRNGFVSNKLVGSHGYHTGGVLFLEKNATIETIYHEGIHAVQAGISGGTFDWYLSWKGSYSFYDYRDSPWERYAFYFSNRMVLYGN